MIRRRPRTAFVPSILKVDVQLSPLASKTMIGKPSDTDARSETNTEIGREERCKQIIEMTEQVAKNSRDEIPAVELSETINQSQNTNLPLFHQIPKKKADLETMEESRNISSIEKTLLSSPGNNGCQDQNSAPINHAQNETKQQSESLDPKNTNQTAENVDAGLTQTSFRRSRAKFAPKLNLAVGALKPQPSKSSKEMTSQEQAVSIKNVTEKPTIAPEGVALQTSAVPQNQVSNIGFTPENQLTDSNKTLTQNVDSPVTSWSQDNADSSESIVAKSQSEGQDALGEPKDQRTPHRRGKFKLAPKIFAPSPKANSTPISAPAQTEKILPIVPKAVTTNNVESAPHKPETVTTETIVNIQHNVQLRSEVDTMECSEVHPKTNETIVSEENKTQFSGETDNLDGPVEVLPTNIFQRRPKSRFLPSGVSLNSLGKARDERRPKTTAINSLGSPGRPAMSQLKSVEQTEAASREQSFGGDLVDQSSLIPQQGAQETAGLFPLAVETLGAHHAESRAELSSHQSAVSEKQQPITSSTHFPATADEYHQLQQQTETTINKTGEPPAAAKKERPAPISIDLEQLKIRRSSLTLGELISCSVRDFRKMDPSCKIEAPDLEELMKAQVQEKHRRKVDTNVSGILTFDSIKKEFVEHAAKKENPSYVTKFEPKSEDADSTDGGERNNNTVGVGVFSKQESIDDDNDCRGTSNVFAPRLKMGEDGKFVLDEESLVIEQTSELTLNSGVVTQASSMPIGTYHKTLQRFALRNHRGFSLRWTDEELKRFFMAMQMVGVDFLMIMTLMPDRSHKELRSKFNTIDKSDPTWADRLLGRPLRYDRQLLISRYKADLRNMSQQNYEKRRMKLQFEAMRRNDKSHFKEWFLERDFEQEAEERAEKLRKESGMKSKGSKTSKRKQKDALEIEEEDADEIDTTDQSNEPSSSGFEKGKKGQKRKSKAAATGDGSECQVNSQESNQSNSQASSQPKSKKVRRSKKVKIESDGASKPGPGRPVITGESSSETIRLSIEAAIDRYNKIKDATSNLELDPGIVSSPFDDLEIRDFDANQISLKQELNTSAPTSPSHLDFISVNVQYPSIALSPCNDLEATLSPSSSISVPRVPGIHSALPSMCNSPAMPDHADPIADVDVPSSDMHQHFDLPAVNPQPVNGLCSNRSGRIVRDISVTFTKPVVEADPLSKITRCSHLMDSYVDSSQYTESSQLVDSSQLLESSKLMESAGTSLNYLQPVEMDSCSTSRPSNEFSNPDHIDVDPKHSAQFNSLKTLDQNDVSDIPSPSSNTQAKLDVPHDSSVAIQKCIDLVACLSSANTNTSSTQKASKNRGTKRAACGKSKVAELSDEASNTIASSIDSMLHKIVQNSSFLDDYSKVSLNEADLKILEQESFTDQTLCEGIVKISTKENSSDMKKLGPFRIAKSESQILTDCDDNKKDKVPEMWARDSICSEGQATENCELSQPNELTIASDWEKVTKDTIRQDSVTLCESLSGRSGYAAKSAISLDSTKLPEELAEILENDLSDGEMSKLANDFNRSFSEENTQVDKVPCKDLIEHSRNNFREELKEPSLVHEALPDSEFSICEPSVNDLHTNDLDGNEFSVSEDKIATKIFDLGDNNGVCERGNNKSTHAAITQELARIENGCSVKSSSVNDLENGELQNELTESSQQCLLIADGGSSKLVSREPTPFNLKFDESTNCISTNRNPNACDTKAMNVMMQKLVDERLQNYSPCNDLENNSTYHNGRLTPVEMSAQVELNGTSLLRNDSSLQANCNAEQVVQINPQNEIMESQGQLSQEFCHSTGQVTEPTEIDSQESLVLQEEKDDHVDVEQLSNQLGTELNQDSQYDEPIQDNNQHIPYPMDRIPSPPPIPANGEIGLIVLPEKLPYAFYFDGVNMIPGLVSESPEDPMAVQSMESGDSGIESGIQEQANDSTSTEAEVMEVQEINVEPPPEPPSESRHVDFGAQNHEPNISEKIAIESNDIREINEVVDNEFDLESENEFNMAKESVANKDLQTESTFLKDVDYDSIERYSSSRVHQNSVVGQTIGAKGNTSCQIQMEKEMGIEKRVTVKRKQISPTPTNTTSMPQLGFELGFGPPKSQAAKTNPNKANKQTLPVQQHSSPLVSTIHVDEDTDGGQELNDFSLINSKSSKESVPGNLGFIDRRSTRPKTPPRISISSSQISHSSPVGSSRSKQTSILNDSGFVSQVVLDNLRDDHLITEIMQETEVIDIDAIEETIGVPNSSTNVCSSKSNANCDDVVFMPRITKRNRTVDQFDDLEDNNEFDSIENNFTIRH